MSYHTAKSGLTAAGQQTGLYKVILHGRDRHGYSTELHCTLVQSGKAKVLAYRDTDGTRQTKPIRDYPGKYYTIGGDGCWGWEAIV